MKGYLGALATSCAVVPTIMGWAPAGIAAGLAAAIVLAYLALNEPTAAKPVVVTRMPTAYERSQRKHWHFGFGLAWVAGIIPFPFVTLHRR